LDVRAAVRGQARVVEEEEWAGLQVVRVEIAFVHHVGIRLRIPLGNPATR